MSSVDFTQCSLDFLNNITVNPTYALAWRFQVPTNASDTLNSTVTVDGCKALCGTGKDYYPWDQVASTITTWVLPVIGLLLQAPYESNKPLQTIYAVCRWLGSPIASLSYIFWNIKVTAKCAMLVDMSVGYREQPGKDSKFSELRDSLYILSVMNQYVVKPSLPGAVTEKLLRVALFSEALQLPNSRKTMVQHRTKLAGLLRSGRRRGAVPVFVSLMWFTFSLILSIQQAFGTIGENRTAHDLALGFLLGWLPILVLSCIVDRNPVVPDDIRNRLNKFLATVRRSLMDSDTRLNFISGSEGQRVDYTWIDDMEIYYPLGEPDANDFDTLFTHFAGQGRVRWHYGVAHPILTSTEAIFVADYGRGWLHSSKARRALVHGTPYRRNKDPLHHFDLREIWQIASGIVLVGGTIAGAFTLSFLTPTVGLGCRSGGYLNFFAIAITALITEMLVWWTTSFNNVSEDARDWTRRWFDRVLRLAEAASTGWLSYIVMAQALGSYRTCECMGSRWGGSSMGGYINFDLMNQAPASLARQPWVIGTSIACATMGLGCSFIIIEWCCQSHLATSDYQSAMNGLTRTRLFKKYTSWVRTIPDRSIEGVKVLKSIIFGGRSGRRSLVWSWTSEPRRIQIIHGQTIPRDRQGSSATTEPEYQPGSKSWRGSSPLVKFPCESLSRSGPRNSVTVSEDSHGEPRGREGSDATTLYDGYELTRYPSTNDRLLSSPTTQNYG